MLNVSLPPAPLLLLLQIASDGLKGRVVEVCLADLQNVSVWRQQHRAEQQQQQQQQEQQHGTVSVGVERQQGGAAAGIARRPRHCWGTTAAALLTPEIADATAGPVLAKLR